MTYDILQQKYTRPSLIILTEDEPKLGTTGTKVGKWDLGTNYLYLSDNNRADLAISFERIEHRQRMINGTMRSYHIADKKTYSTSWSKLPSRKKYVTEYDSTNTGFGAGQEMLDWYNSHNGSFWVLFVYDIDSSITSVQNNVEKVNVFFENFSYNVVTRGQDTDLWNINLSLVEA